MDEERFPKPMTPEFYRYLCQRDWKEVQGGWVNDTEHHFTCPTCRRAKQACVVTLINPIESARGGIRLSTCVECQLSDIACPLVTAVVRPRYHWTGTGWEKAVLGLRYLDDEDLDPGDGKQDHGDIPRPSSSASTTQLLGGEMVVPKPHWFENQNAKYDRPGQTSRIVERPQQESERRPLSAGSDYVISLPESYSDTTNESANVQDGNRGDGVTPARTSLREGLLVARASQLDPAYRRPIPHAAQTGVSNETTQVIHWIPEVEGHAIDHASGTQDPPPSDQPSGILETPFQYRPRITRHCAIPGHLNAATLAAVQEQPSPERSERRVPLAGPVEHGNAAVTDQAQASADPNLNVCGSKRKVESEDSVSTRHRPAPNARRPPANILGFSEQNLRENIMQVIPPPLTEQEKWFILAIRGCIHEAFNSWNRSPSPSDQ